MSKRLAERLRDERRERGESQRTTAPRFGISQSGYALWETGVNNPEPALWDAVASFLGITADEVRLLIYDDDPNPALGAEIGQRIDRLEAMANGIVRQMADLQRALDKLTAQGQSPKTRRAE